MPAGRSSYEAAQNRFGLLLLDQTSNGLHRFLKFIQSSKFLKNTKMDSVKTKQKTGKKTLRFPDKKSDKHFILI